MTLSLALLLPVPRARPSLGPQSWQMAQACSERSALCSSFKLFLELEPQVRDIIFKFYESKYASCLKMLDEMKVRGLAWTEGGRGQGPRAAPL